MRGDPRSVEVVEVIRVLSNRGKGIDGDPVRGVISYWAKDGEWLAEFDPYEPDSEGKTGEAPK